MDEEKKVEEVKNEGVVETSPATEENPYEAELKRFKEKAEREETTRKHERAKRKELQTQVEEMQSQTEADIEALVEAKLAPIKQNYLSTVMESELTRLVDDPHRRELVKHHYENSIKPTGDIQRDLDTALALADAVKYREKAEKEARVSVAKQKAATMSPAGSGTTVAPDGEKLSSKGQELKGYMDEFKTRFRI